MIFQMILFQKSDFHNYLYIILLSLHIRIVVIHISETLLVVLRTSGQNKSARSSHQPRPLDFGAMIQLCMDNSAGSKTGEKIAIRIENHS